MINIDKLSYRAKIRLAETSNDINILVILSKDRSSIVRGNVALNKNTLVETLILLSKDTDVETRYCVAYNTNTSVEILKELINDENKHVREKALARLVELKGLICFI